MAGEHKRSAEVEPTPGPWLVGRTADEGASQADFMLGAEPSAADAPSGQPYLIYRAHTAEIGESPRLVATGIHCLADARLMAAAHDLAEMLLRLLTAPDLTMDDLDPGTRAAIDDAWTLLVRAAPYLEI